MSIYPPWWDTTVTVYNKYTDANTRQVTWYKHTVYDCFWKNSNDKVKIGNTVLDSESTICRIRLNPLFVPANAWKTLPESEKSTYFTLGVGDILICDEVDDEIDEYTPGKRSSDLMTKYHNLQGCLQVDKAVISVGPNIPIPHYRVKGV